MKVSASLFSDKQFLGLAVVGLVVFVGGGMYLRKKAADALETLNPTNPENPAAKAADKLTEKLTGGKSKTVGGYWATKCKEKDYKPWYCPNPF